MAVAIYVFGVSEMQPGPAVEAPEPVAERLTAATDAEEPLLTSVATSAVAAEPVRRVHKPRGVTLVSSTGKLSDLFSRIGYELEGVRNHGQVPRLFIASLPHDIRKMSEPSQRKIVFIQSILPLILHVNELITHDRSRIKALRQQMADGHELSAEDETWLVWMADRYGLDGVDFDALLRRVDAIPPSLAIAQAAEESGWGTSRFAHEGNALFGQRSYKSVKKGIVPKERAEGMKFKVRAFDHLIDGVKAYVHNLNSHFAYKKFRSLRETMREAGDRLDGYRLVGTLERYSERGEAYIKTIRIIMRVNALQVFDAARLGERVVATEDGFNPDA